MLNHIILPGIEIKTGFSHDAYTAYLKNWYEQAISDAENGKISSSICHQAVLIDLIINGQVRHDWLSIMDDLLTHNELPIAYSANYSKQLYKFDAQYLQSTIHSIHTRWWIEKIINGKNLDHEKYASFILRKKNTNGLIYDFDTSETILRHRMKVELTMSAAMGIEILIEAGKISTSLLDELSTSLCDPRKIVPFVSITSEQFRLSALALLNKKEQFPIGIADLIDACSEGLDFGWNDFPIKLKTDVYMGTIKRTGYDKPIHSPLIACQVSALSNIIESNDKRINVKNRLSDYAKRLRNYPLDIPAFQMREIPIPFGSDITPIESICASWLIANEGSQDDRS